MKSSGAKLSARLRSIVLIAGFSILPAASTTLWATPGNDSPVHGPSRPFAGTFTSEELTLTLGSDESLPGDNYVGRIVVGDVTFRADAQAVDGRLTGRFLDKDGHAFDFTAEIAGDTLIFQTGGKVRKLKMSAPPTPKNPLADSGPAKHPPMSGAQRERGERISVANLRNLSAELIIYENGHDRQVPASVAELVKLAGISPGNMNCPLGYTYVMTGKPINITKAGSVPDETVVMYEKGDDDGPKNIVFADNSIQSFPAKDAARIIAAGKCEHGELK